MALITDFFARLDFVASVTSELYEFSPKSSALSAMATSTSFAVDGDTVKFLPFFSIPFRVGKLVHITLDSTVMLIFLLQWWEICWEGLSRTGA
jgi:hypothetical protein